MTIQGYKLKLNHEHLFNFINYLVNLTPQSHYFKKNSGKGVHYFLTLNPLDGVPKLDI